MDANSTVESTNTNDGVKGCESNRTPVYSVVSLSFASKMRSREPSSFLYSFFLLVISLLSSGVITPSSGLESCTRLGFKETLICSSCDDLAQFVKEEELIEDCRRCCAEERDKGVQVLWDQLLRGNRYPLERYSLYDSSVSFISLPLLFFSFYSSPPTKAQSSLCVNENWGGKAISHEILSFIY